jgi:hypothetical protein
MDKIIRCSGFKMIAAASRNKERALLGLVHRLQLGQIGTSGRLNSTVDIETPYIDNDKLT